METHLTPCVLGPTPPKASFVVATDQLDNGIPVVAVTESSIWPRRRRSRGRSRPYATRPAGRSPWT